MRPRLGFALSLLAACGVHAIALFVPRAALVQDVHVPTVEIELTEVTGPQGPAAPPAPAIVPIAARAPTQVEAPPQPEAPPGTVAAAEPSGAEPPLAAAGAEAETPVIDQPVVGALPAVDAPEASSGVESVAVQSPAGGASSAAASSPAAPSPAGAAHDGAAGASTRIAAPAFVPPRPVSEVLPTYPLSARRSGFEGLVKVSVLVDESGAVTGVEVLSSSGHASLDQAVLDALRHAHFAPAQQDGKPVPGRVVIPVRFRLSSVAR